MSARQENVPDWESLLAAERYVPVGGAAAALHASHRLNMDGDHLLDALRSRFERERSPPVPASTSSSDNQRPLPLSPNWSSDSSATKTPDEADVDLANERGS